MATVPELLKALSDTTALDRLPLFNGQLLLVNLRNSCRENLLDHAKVLEWLEKCAKRYGGGGLIEALKIANLVSIESDWGAPSRFRFMRNAQQDGLEESWTVSTITTYSAFFDRHYDGFGATMSGAEVLDSTPPTDDDDLKVFREKFERATSVPGWYRKDASLGKPPVGSCWVSINSFLDLRADDAAMYSAGSDFTDADVARDLLGLVYDQPKVHLIRYSFTASSCTRASGGDIARPAFVDGGNARFLTGRRCPRSDEMADAGWGCTVHLGRLPDTALHPASGGPERVVRSMRLADIPDLKLEYLHVTKLQRGITASDNDEAFAKLLKNGERLADICDQIQEFASGKPI